MQQRCHHASASARSLQLAATARREKVQLRIREQTLWVRPAGGKYSEDIYVSALPWHEPVLAKKKAVRTVYLRNAVLFQYNRLEAGRPPTQASFSPSRTVCLVLSGGPTSVHEGRGCWHELIRHCMLPPPHFQKVLTALLPVKYHLQEEATCVRR
jgi:hypothetical protein